MILFSHLRVHNAGNFPFAIKILVIKLLFVITAVRVASLVLLKRSEVFNF